MFRVIDLHKLTSLRDMAVSYADSDVLRRDGKVFFIGGNLPVYSTLETMYESYCLESSELFHVTFGDESRFDHNLEMVRQIKRNFSIRVMGRVGYPLSDSQIEKIYLAGLDVLDIPGTVYTASADSERKRAAFSFAVATFKRWSVVSSISPEDAQLTVRDTIHELIGSGVIPLLEISGNESLLSVDELRSLFEYLAAEWHRKHVPLKPIMPLLRLTTPFVIAEPTGFLRGVIDKLQDRHVLATSDLRRHLRTSGAEASFESAGL